MLEDMCFWSFIEKIQNNLTYLKIYNDNERALKKTP